MGVFTGKTAVVTGASSGIGRAIALSLGEAGAHVFAAGRRKEALAGTVAAMAAVGGTATAVPADLRDPGEVQGLVDRAMSDTGRLDVMVNNAGVSFLGPLADGDPEAWREMLEINVLALAVGSQAAVRAMRACHAEGHIVNISSSATRREAPGFYGATKMAVNAITTSLRQELENDTIRVITVIPGLTATNLARHQPDLLGGLAALLGEEIEPLSGGLLPQEVLDRAADVGGPIMARADDVARAVLFAITQPMELSISEIAVQPGQAPGHSGVSPPRGDAESRRAAILDAALRVFGQYGYRRTSMDDIAREAEIGKGTIYLSFASKEEVFQALSQRLAERMLAGAEAASRRPGSTADKLAAMHAAWFGTYAETVRQSPHAAELLDAKHRLSADLVADAARRYKRLVRDVLTDAAAAGELDLEPAGLTADSAAELLIASARGLESVAASPAAYRRYLDALVRVMIAGLSSRLPADPVPPPLA